jgi:hypothetical protein
LAAVSEIAFYEAAVQIIPLLLIVIAFESRFSTDRLPTWAYVVSFVVAMFIFYAELTALGVLRTGKGSDWSETIVYIAITAELAGILGLIFPLYRTGPGKRD